MSNQQTGYRAMELSYKEFAGLIVELAESIVAAAKQNEQTRKQRTPSKVNFTKKQIGLIEGMYGSNFAVSITTRGNIKIAKYYDEPKHWFVIGKNKMGYWVRQYKVSRWGGVNVWRPNLKNDKYTFDSFEDAVDYFDKRLSWKL